MKLKTFITTVGTILLMVILLLFSFWFGYIIEKPIPIAEQQMMNLQTYLGVEPDGKFGPLTREAYEKTVDREWREANNKWLEQFYTPSGGPE